MLTIDKLRVGVAGISIGTLQRGNPPIDRMAQQAALSQKTMQEKSQHDWTNTPTFNGVSDKLDMPYATELNPTSFTVEMWVMVEGGTGYQSIVSSVGGSPLEGRKGYLFCITPSRQWQFWLGNGEPRALWKVLTGPKVIPAVWTHLAGTYDRQSQIMTFYVDGQEVGRQMDVQYQPNDRNPMRVGAGATEQLGASPCFFCGKIAEVHVWNRVLSTGDIQALSTQRSIQVQAEPITEIAPSQSANAQEGQSMNLSPKPSHPNTPASSSKPTIETLTPPVVEIAPQSATATSMSLPQSVLWQIGTPGQAGIPAPTGAWTQVYNYTIGTDPDAVNRPTLPSCLVPPSASKIPNSTSQLNIYFVLAEDYTEGQLVLCYDRYGSGEDYIYLDGQLIAKTPSADKVKLKQTQIPLGVVFTGPHTLSITVSNSADSAHVIDYLQLQTTKPMLNNLTSQLLPLGGNQRPTGGNQKAAQNPQAQGGLGSGLVGGLLEPVTDVVNQATGVVGQVAGAAGLPGEVLGQATGLVGGLAGQVAGAAGLPGEVLGQATGLVGGLAGQATGLVGGLAGQATGAAGLPGEILGQATGLVGGLAGQVAGAAGLPGEVLGQATGLLGGLAGAGGNAALVNALLGQATGLAGGLLPGQSAANPQVAAALSVEVVVQLAGLINQLSALIAQLSQMLNQLGVVNQSAGLPMLSPQQLAQLQQLAQQQQLAQLQQLAQQQQLAQLQQLAQQQQLAQLQAAGRLPMGTQQLQQGVSPQQLAQLQAAQQMAGGVSPQQLAQLQAAQQMAGGLSPQQLALYRQQQGAKQIV